MNTVKLPEKQFLTRDIITIVQIGCGGNGGWLVPHVARMISTFARDIRYMIIDGDKVEKKNIVRQNFIAADVGKYKSEVLAHRYSAAFGVEIESVAKYINPQVMNDVLDTVHANHTSNYLLIVSCVDNHKTRMEIHSVLNSQPPSLRPLWVDVGNDMTNGQVFISGYFLGPHTRVLTDIVHTHPEIAAANDKKPDELSCAEHLLTGDQTLGVNVMAANLTFNVINALLRKNRVCYYEVNFSTNNTTTKRFIDDYVGENNHVFA